MKGKKKQKHKTSNGCKHDFCYQARDPELGIMQSFYFCPKCGQTKETKTGGRK